MSKESKLVKNTSIIALGNIFTKCVSFFMLPLYTSILSTEEYGVVDLIQVTVSFLVILLTCQMEMGVFRYLVLSRDNPEKQKEYVTVAIYFVASVNIVFVLLAVPVLMILHYPYTYFLVITVFANVFSTLGLNIARGIGDNIGYSIGSCIFGTSCVLLNVLFVAIIPMGASGMLLATVLANIFTALFTFLRIRIWKLVQHQKPEKTAYKDLFRYSLPLIPYTLCWWIIDASDRVIIRAFLGLAANGVYSIAHKFPALYTTATGIFQTAWIESASENVHAEDRNQFYQKIYGKTVRMYSSCCMGIIAILPVMFSFLVKKDFGAAYPFIPILMIGALLQSISSFYGSLYFAFMATKKVASTNIWATAINLVFNICLIRKIGLYAAALSTVAAYFVAIIIRRKEIHVKTGVSMPVSYILAESFAYLAVLTGYYLKNQILSLILLILVIPHCIYQNQEILKDIYRKVLKRE